MNTITHLLVGWAFAEQTSADDGDISLIAWAGVAPDLDGLGALVDGVNHLFGCQTFLYGAYHHFLLHGLFGALVLPAALAVRARHRLRVFLCGVLAVHLHLLCDLVGSRGPDPADIWPIQYFGPFTEHWSLAWSGQWALNAWPNIALTLALIAYAFLRAATCSSSPLRLFGPTANAVFVGTVRARWGRIRAKSSAQNS